MGPGEWVDECDDLEPSCSVFNGENGARGEPHGHEDGVHDAVESLGGIDDPCECEPEPDECDRDAREPGDGTEDAQRGDGDAEEWEGEQDDECLEECED